MSALRNKLIILLISIWSMPAAAGNTDVEIRHLLEVTGESECTFVRNEKSHTAPEAEAHLRMKYGRGKKWVSSAEQFIDRIASKSSWTGKPYFIDCPDTGRRTADDWFSTQLDSFRAKAEPAT